MELYNEVIDMKINNNETLHAFEKAIDNCSSEVYLVSPRGEQYNLKNPIEKYEGIAELLKDKWEQLELFTSKRADEKVMFDFYSKYCAA